jgi:hypothetical protein
LEKVGTMSWDQVDINQMEDEKFDTLCKARTYGPLIKSPAEDPNQDTQQEESAAKSEDS